MLLDQTQGTEMERLWNLLGELSSQLSHNRQQTEELHRRADELRRQAVHSQTGFTLRRFNVDVSKEEFDSELERLNVSLVMENQALQQENRQLSSLLKDYESTLDAVMSKFRSYAHASQQHDLELTRHYESLLLSMPVTLPTPPHNPNSDSTESSFSPPIDPSHLQLSLSHLASLIRKAMRSLQGEDPEDSTSPLLHPITDDHSNTLSLDALASQFESLSTTTSSNLSRTRSSSVSSQTSLPSTSRSLETSSSSSAEEEEAESQARLIASHHPRTARQPLHDPSSGGYISKNATTNPLYIPTTSTSSLVASPPRAQPPQQETNTTTTGQVNGKTVGTSARKSRNQRFEDEEEERREREEVERNERFKSRGLGPLDDALLREIEVEALRRENEELKKLLGIDRELEEEEEEEEEDEVDEVEREEEMREEEEDGGRRGQGKVERRLLFESGAKPETLEDEQDEEEEDDESKEPELSQEDSDLFNEILLGEDTKKGDIEEDEDEAEEEPIEGDVPDLEESTTKEEVEEEPKTTEVTENAETKGETEEKGNAVYVEEAGTDST
ncbi:hypothetical protein JCM16303_007149 [Sporobolomyces ruberrimus]